MRSSRPTSINLPPGLLKQLDRQVKIEGVRSRSALIQELLIEGLDRRGYRGLGPKQVRGLPLQGDLGGALAILKAARFLGRALDMSGPTREAVDDLADAASLAVLAITEGGAGPNQGVSLRSIAPAPERSTGVRKHDYHD